MIQTKVVDLNEINKLVVVNVFIWNHLLSQKFVWSSHSFKSKIRIVETKFDREMAKTRVVDQDESCDFIVGDLLISNSLLF